MCMNCGCGELDDRHGNDANLITDDIRKAATASGLDMSKTIGNLEDSLRRVGGGMATPAVGGQTGMGSSGQTGMGQTPRSGGFQGNTDDQDNPRT